MYKYARFNYEKEKKNSLKNNTWSLLGKQNAQAEEVNFRQVYNFSYIITLIRAARLNHTKIAEILLENGASIEAKNMMDMTPFLIAVPHGAKETVEVLLDRGADLFARDSFHNSGLHLAVMYKRKEMIHTLLKRGKEKLVELRNNDLQTVMHLAARYEEPEVV